MSKAVTTQSDAPCTGLACERQLRTAAAVFSRLGAGEITATRVVGVLGADDTDRFRARVGEIADEYGLDATITFHVGSFAVRFTPCIPVPDEPRRARSPLSLLARIAHRNGAPEWMS